jgi:hypothetical protein
MRGNQLLLNVLDLLPLALQILLPQADLVVATADGKNVAAQTPADTPQNGVKFECLAGPLVGAGRVRGPDADGLVLRGRGNVRFGQDARRPGHIPDPV